MCASRRRTASKIDTDQATYNDATGIVDMPGAVTFSRGRLSGTRHRRDVHRDHGNLSSCSIRRRAQVAPGPEGKGAVVGDVQDDDAAARQEVAADGPRREDRRRVRDARRATPRCSISPRTRRASSYLELRGKASVVPLANAPDAAPEMHADRHHADLPARRPHAPARDADDTGVARADRSDGDASRSTASWIDVYTAPDGQHAHAASTRRTSVIVDLPATGDNAGADDSGDHARRPAATRRPA